MLRAAGQLAAASAGPSAGPSAALAPSLALARARSLACPSQLPTASANRKRSRMQVSGSLCLQPAEPVGPTCWPAGRVNFCSRSGGLNDWPPTIAIVAHKCGLLLVLLLQLNARGRRPFDWRAQCWLAGWRAPAEEGSAAQSCERQIPSACLLVCPPARPSACQPACQPESQAAGILSLAANLARDLSLLAVRPAKCAAQTCNEASACRCPLALGLEAPMKWALPLFRCARLRGSSSPRGSSPAVFLYCKSSSSARQHCNATTSTRQFASLIGKLASSLPAQWRRS